MQIVRYILPMFFIMDDTSNHIQIILHVYHSINLRLSYAYHSRLWWWLENVKMIGIFRFLNFVTSSTATNQQAYWHLQHKIMAYIWFNKRRINKRDEFIKTQSHIPIWNRKMEIFTEYICYDLIGFTCNISGILLFSCQSRLVMIKIVHFIHLPLSTM